MKDVTPPAWVARFRYAEKYHCQPHEVGAMPMRWWLRWLELVQADAARDAFDSPPGEKPTPADADAKLWAMIEGRY